MKSKLNKLMAALLALVLLLSLSATAYAAELNGIKVKIKLSGNYPGTPETYKVTLTAKGDSPMPLGSTEGVYTLSMRGAGEKSFPAIRYGKPGIYHYTIQQLPGTNKKCTYDPAVYDLTVYVTSSKEGLEVSTILTLHGSEAKLDTVTFTNKYEAKPLDPYIPRTNDESNFPLYIAMAMGSILVLAVLYLTRRREDAEE